MKDVPFCDAVLPAGAAVLRLPLRPYSVGHELILQRERNALALLPEGDFSKLPIEDQVMAIRRAALICWRNWEGNQTSARGLWFWSWLTRDADWSREAEIFRAYRAAGSTFPPAPNEFIDRIYNDAGNGRFLGAEAICGVVNFLLGRCERLGFKTAYNVPYGMALHLYYTELEFSGSRRIENADEKQRAKERYEHLKDIEQERAEVIKNVKFKMQNPEAANG